MEGQKQANVCIRRTRGLPSSEISARSSGKVDRCVAISSSARKPHLHFHYTNMQMVSYIHVEKFPPAGKAGSKNLEVCIDSK